MPAASSKSVSSKCAIVVSRHSPLSSQRVRPCAPPKAKARPTPIAPMASRRSASRTQAASRLLGGSIPLAEKETSRMAWQTRRLSSPSTPWASRKETAWASDALVPGKSLWSSTSCSSAASLQMQTSAPSQRAMSAAVRLTRRAWSTPWPDASPANRSHTYAAAAAMVSSSIMPRAARRASC